MQHVPWLLTLTVLGGCKPEWYLRGDDDDDKVTTTDTTGGDADVDADTDADGDADGDADTDSDADTDPSGLDCGATYPTPDPGLTGLGACVTEVVHCGDVIYGTLEGGSTTYDYDFWEMVGELGSLFGDPTALDGEERVYVFEDGAPDQVVRATFETCFDLWADWILYGDTSGAYCDTSTYFTAGVFEGGTGLEWSTDRLNPSGSYDFEFIVEGKHGATGNYKLTIECF